MTYTLEDEVADLESKYSDEEIKEKVDNAVSEKWDTSVAIAYSQVAQAMIAYNNMIDARVERYTSQVNYSGGNNA